MQALAAIYDAYSAVVYHLLLGPTPSAGPSHVDKRPWLTHRWRYTILTKLPGWEAVTWGMSVLDGHDQQDVKASKRKSSKIA